MGLNTLLADGGEFDVVSVADPEAIEHDVGAGRPSVLIVEGANPTACQNYLDRNPFIRSVVVFDPVGAHAFIGLTNPDWRRLAAIVRAAAQERRVRVVDPRDLHRSEADAAEAAAMAPLTEWLELSLGRALRRRLGRDLPGVPGWSIAPDEAFELLGLDPQGNPESLLTERLTAADSALVCARTTLPVAIARLATVFWLSDLELRLLCLVLAPELDGRFATAIAVLQDDLTRRRPGLTLLAELMAPNEVDTWHLRRTVHASNSIIAAGLVHPAGSEGLQVDVGLAPSRAVVSHLLATSIERAVAASDAVLQVPATSAGPPSVDETLLAQFVERHRAASPSTEIHLIGGGPGKAWFRRLVAALGLPLLVGDLGRIEPGPRRVAAVGDWGVLSRLAGSALLVLGIDGLGAVERSQVGARLGAIAGGIPLVAADGDPGTEWSWRTSALSLRAPTISTAQRAAWWRSSAGRAGLELDADDIRRLAATAPIDPESIDRSVAVAAGHRRRTGDSAVTVVQRAARELAPVHLPQGVRQVTPTYTWDDIVLSDPRKELLQAILVHVLQASRVLEEWGFASRIPYGQGVAALFSGPSGTGKTMAAQIIAGALGVELLQVDLSKTISKYIGETEKNLDAIFDAAEAAGSVLLFDEADAVFGKRTEIKDAHDRHANVEVATSCSEWSPSAAWPCSPRTSGRTSTMPSSAGCASSSSSPSPRRRTAAHLAQGLPEQRAAGPRRRRLADGEPAAAPRWQHPEHRPARRVPCGRGRRSHLRDPPAGRHPPGADQDRHANRGTRPRRTGGDVVSVS
ncbi:hypothetical protein BJF90_34860 [Pseudonocardia sp. CNS-004]|nr:hypothetical protein BJF90_34860 [Pseudonocardia sp. CNS-004]